MSISMKIAVSGVICLCVALCAFQLVTTDKARSMAAATIKVSFAAMLIGALSEVWVNQ